MSFHYGTERSLCRPELATEESMDARRAALRDRIPAELDIIGIEIPAGSWGRLLQDSIAARIVQKRVGGVARDAEVVAQSDLRGNRRCGAELRVPYDKITQYSHRVTHIITGSGCGEGGAPGGRVQSDRAIRPAIDIDIARGILVRTFGHRENPELSVLRTSRPEDGVAGILGDMRAVGGRAIGLRPIGGRGVTHVDRLAVANLIQRDADHEQALADCVGAVIEEIVADGKIGVIHRRSTEIEGGRGEIPVGPASGAGAG